MDLRAPALDRKLPARAMGLATVAYSVAIIARPRIMAKQCGLLDNEGRLDDKVATLTRGIGARDLIVSAAMMTAPGSPLVSAFGGARALSDLSDAIGFGTHLPDHDKRKKVALFSASWAAACAATALLARSAS